MIITLLLLFHVKQYHLLMSKPFYICDISRLITFNLYKSTFGYGIRIYFRFLSIKTKIYKMYISHNFYFPPLVQRVDL